MLKQTKLLRSEWESIEIPIDGAEKRVIRLLIDSYDKNDTSVKISPFQSLISFLKVAQTTEMDLYLYRYYYDLKNPTKLPGDKIKKSDKIRIKQNSQESIQHCWETILLETVANVKKNPQVHIYKLYKLLQTNVILPNSFVYRIGKTLFDEVEKSLLDMNTVLRKTIFDVELDDMELYDHQKQLFANFRNPHFQKLQDLFAADSDEVQQPEQQLIPDATFIMYMAPTGTGKTLTPIAVSSQFRIIFVCAARHVGLSLARSAISVNKKVGFAFGCSSTEDIRLHNSAAVVFKTDKRSGSICKIDNSVGNKVEIMISDVCSYEYAMLYMTAFNHARNIVTFWDEPTISLDVADHELHTDIQSFWRANTIPNLILSSATLPKMDVLSNVTQSFQNKFPEAKVNFLQICSYELKKSIPLLTTEGFVMMPHFMHEDYANILTLVAHCKNNLTLLRYFDLAEILSFLKIVEENNFVSTAMFVDNVFTSMKEVTVEKIKQHYLTILGNIKTGCWGALYLSLKLSRTRLYSNEGHEMDAWGIYLSTWDSYTLTDGPTMFLTTDVEKIGKFLIQKSCIPSEVLANIYKTITENNRINERLERISSKLEPAEKESSGKSDEDGTNKSKKEAKEKQTLNGYQTKLKDEETILLAQLKVVELAERYVPNKPRHLEVWKRQKLCKSFCSNIAPNIVKRVMMLTGVTDDYKLLLLMGIGVFSSTIENEQYLEIMKQLASEQKLYLIVASGDYVYGTNYQFCHGYLSKDLQLTQEKMIQCIGRVGRKQIHQKYTIRLRDDKYGEVLFMPQENQTEVNNMNRLLL